MRNLIATNHKPVCLSNLVAPTLLENPPPTECYDEP